MTYQMSRAWSVQTIATSKHAITNRCIVLVSVHRSSMVMERQTPNLLASVPSPKRGIHRADGVSRCSEAARRARNGDMRLSSTGIGTALSL